jgi:hypothetical protein
MTEKNDADLREWAEFVGCSMSGMVNKVMESFFYWLSLQGEQELRGRNIVSIIEDWESSFTPEGIERGEVE